MTDDGLLFVETDRFHGPLDLLLHLIRTQDIDIFDIPIARITRQFLTAIEELGDADVNEAGEFLQMAATLVGIKARMLMPSPAGEEEHDPRAELVRRLLEYEQVREIATRLRAAENDRSRRHGKGYVEPRHRKWVAEVPLTVTWNEVFQAALSVQVPAERDREHRVFARRVAMREKADLIAAAVGRVGRIEFASLVAPWAERIHAVMTLLAGLELGRRRAVSLRQRKPFSALWIYGPREEHSE
ncbi:MAG: hypothetical protein F4087_02325 [Gemmatimonadetes bacterium]|nr:segregation/condensation protein A [Gemmatimonadota bacterium]MDE2677910.1 segregation/condensation protein A [Gemmatimonadota bacterium]MXX34879.1 hypothetical protein [Gemmatimonadota bacterium]MYA11619.1 hypothetical protein [Gemmatimonadota bacterium]MYD13689.1 hypothetical protein [Gemmatimonadota bacterium]